MLFPCKQRFSFHFNNSFSFYPIHFLPNLLFWWGVHWNEDKQTQNLVSFDPAESEVSKM